MNLLSKLKLKLAGELAETNSPSKAMEELDKLPEPEKVKVLDYLQTAAKLHEPKS
ncbi:hypothetical protein CCP3SC5AM1_2870002 [Gammaproteobacteria bacterium]